jgi:hypothetical protein
MRLGGFEPPSFGLEVDAYGFARFRVSSGTGFVEQNPLA